MAIWRLGRFVWSSRFVVLKKTPYLNGGVFTTHIPVFLLPPPNHRAGIREREKKLPLNRVCSATAFSTYVLCAASGGCGITGVGKYCGRKTLHDVANSEPYDLVCTNRVVTALRVREHTGRAYCYYIVRIVCSPLVSIPNSAATSLHGRTKANNKKQSAFFDPRPATMFTRY